MKTLFNVTYEIVTHESAEYGEVEDCGFAGENLSLRDALDLVVQTESSHCEQTGVEASCSDIASARWVTVYNSPTYDDGRAESRSIHIPDNVTPASRARILRAVKAHY